VHRPQSVVYKVNYLVLKTLLSFFILLDIKVVFCFYSRMLEVNHTCQIIHDSMEDRTERGLSRSSGRVRLEVSTM